MRRQVRVLFRVFLSRFFENDLAEDAGDFRLAFFALVALLAIPATAAPILIATASMPGHPPQFGWIMTAHLQGIGALRQSVLSDKMLYLGYAMATSGLLAAIAWQSLLPDRRDARVLMPFGLHPRAVIAARLGSLFAYLGLVAVAIHTLPSIAFGSLLAVDNTFTFALRGIAAHFVASVVASLFVGLAIVALQALLALGPRRFTRAASSLHFVVVAGAVGALALLPAASAQLGEALRSGVALDGAWRWLPTTWFLGLYESIVGTTNPVMHSLATWALVSTAALVAIVIAVYPAVYRQTSNAALDEGVGHRRRQTIAAAFARVMSVLVAREPRSRAVAQFFAAAIVRGPRQRLVIALGAGLAGAWALPMWISAARAGAPAMRIGSFAVPIAALFFIIAGVRIAAAMPVEQGGDWLLDLADVDPVRVRGVVVRTIAWLVVAPVVVITTVVCGRWWGWPAAVAHAVFTASLGIAMLESVVGRSARLPCHGAWSMPVEHARRWWPAYVAGVLFGVSGLSAIEYVAIAHPIAIGCISAFLITLAVSVDREVARGLLRPSVVAADAGATLVGALRATRLDTRQTARDASQEGHGAAAPMFVAFHRRSRDESWLDGLDLTPRGLRRDMRFAFRRVARAPMFTLAAIGVLALGIGSLVSARSLLGDFAGQLSVLCDADRVFEIGPPSGALSRADLDDLRARQTAFSSIEAYSDEPSTILTPRETLLVDSQGVTGGYFGTLGVRPVIGRFIDPVDDAPGAPLVAVLGERTWRTAFRSDPTILGTEVRIGGEPYTVVGVAPASLQITRDPGVVAVYVPMAHLPATDRGLQDYRSATGRGVAWLHAVGRLAPGKTANDAFREIPAIGRALDAAAPLAPRAPVPVARSWRLAPAAEIGVRQDRQAGASALLLLPVSIFLIVCTSLANLVLSRGGRRRHEYAVRRAIGASRANLVIELVLELAAIAVAGGCAAWLFAGFAQSAIARLVTATYGEVSRYHIATALAGRDVALLFALVATSVVVAGFVPALSLTAGTASPMMTAASTSTPRWRGRRVAIATQVAASLALLLVASLAVQGMAADAAAFARTETFSRLAVANAPLSLIDRDDERARAHVAAIVEAAAGTASPRDVAVVSARSPAALTFGRVTRPERAADAESRDSTGAEVVAVTPGGVATLGAPIERGRDIGESDVPGAPLAAVISERLARQEFGGLDVAGQHALVLSRDARGIRHQEMATIVGVAVDADTLRTNAETSVVYLPLAQHFTPDVMVIARGASIEHANRLVGSLRDAIRGVDPAIPISFAGRGDLMLGARWVVARVAVEVVWALSLFALIVTMVGLYGVLAQVVAMRRAEMGVRMALGATPGQVLGLVFRDGSAPVAIGLAAGVGLAAIGRLSAQPLFTRAVSAIDVPVALLAATPLVIAAAIACYLPARRASRVDPMRVLKEL